MHACLLMGFTQLGSDRVVRLDLFQNAKFEIFNKWKKKEYVRPLSILKNI